MTKDIFVIGNGPSLNDIDMSLLKDVDTISFNRAYIAYKEWGFCPTYYMVIDRAGISSYNKDINELIISSPIKRFFIATYHNHLKPYTDRSVFSTTRNNVTFLQHNTNPIFDVEKKNSFGLVEKFKLTSSVTISALPILYAMGYENVYLLGCDAKYKNCGSGTQTGTENNDTDHFRNDYFGKGIKFGGANKTGFFKPWVDIKPELDRMKGLGFSVISCTKDSALHNISYEYKDFNDIIQLIK